MTNDMQREIKTIMYNALFNIRGELIGKLNQCDTTLEYAASDYAAECINLVVERIAQELTHDPLFDQTRFENALLWAAEGKR